MGRRTPVAAPSLLSVAASRRQFLGYSAAGLGLGALALTGCAPSGATASTTFTFTFWGTGVEKDAVSKVVNDFAQSHNLTGKPMSIPEQYETKLNTLLAGNNAPDAGYLTQGMAMRLGEQGRIVNVVGVEGLQDLIPSTLHYYAAGKAVSQTCIEAFGLWYNEDVTTEAGVTVPTTPDTAWSWDEFVAAADALTVDTNGRHPSESGFDSGNVARYGTAAPSGLLALTALLKSRGVDLFNSEGTATNIDSPEAIEVLQAVQDLIFEDRVAPTSVEVTNLGGSSALLLGSGRVAMTIDGQWLLPDLSQTAGLKYNVGTLPKFDEYYTVTVSGANAVFASSQHQADAMELLLALADPQQVDLYAGGLWMPPLASYYTDEALIASWVDNDVHPSGYRTAVMEPAMNNQVNYPAYETKNFSAIEAAFGGSLGSIFTEQIDVATAAKGIADQVNPLMQGVYAFS